MTARFTCLILACFAAVLPAGAAERSVVVLFGPAAAETARSGARTAASAVRQFLAAPQATAELRRAGAATGLPLDAKMPSRPFEQAFVDAARDSRDADPAVFANSLDAAAQSLAHRPGARFLLAVLQSPPLSGEAESTLKQTAAFCRANGIKVIVFDPGERSNSIASALTSLAAGTGGAFVTGGKALAASLRAEPAAPPPIEVESSPATPLSSDIPVYTRFLRLSSVGLQSYGVERRTTASGMGTLATQEGGSNVEQGTGPMRGLFVVESPLSALKFDIDDHAGTYLAKARVTQMARNARGRAVWRASKEVTIRGPLSKLPARRAGNLYYLREVVFPGGRYTLEATVEDLLAGKSGGVREPLRTGDGVPGFYVSDALFVRPFTGSVDRFEADQIFAYDGDAMSPVLHPVFRAGEPCNLQIYFVIYPDLYGAQPEVTLEILQNGRSVGRTRIPFTDRIRDTSREGRGTIQGEQKREFPYLASVKGAKLPAGEFEARLTVQQGRNVITRTVPFRVAGTGVPEAAPIAAGSAAPPVSEDEPGEIVLPEVDTVEVHATGPALPAADVERLWREAAANAAGYSGRLPNFRCEQETRRLTAPAKNPERIRAGDVILDELVYENGRETYRTLEINGLKADGTRARLEGVRSRGEFGTMLKSLFGDEVGARYKWAGRAMAGGVLCQVFEVEVAPEKSNFVLSHNDRQEVPGYRGRVFIEEESGLVRRLTINGTGLPKDFQLQSPTLSLEYGMVRVGAQDHLLPLRSVLQVRQGKTLVRNESVFRNYRKFEASSEIKY